MSALSGCIAEVHVLARRYRHIDLLPNGSGGASTMFDPDFSLSATSPPPLMDPNLWSLPDEYIRLADFSDSRQASVVPQKRVQTLANACIPLADMWCEGIDSRQEGSIVRVQQ
jgi:hypothetical protein